MRLLDDVTGAVVDSAIKLHMRIGPGLLESVYTTLLAQDLRRRGFQVDHQQPVSFEIDGPAFRNGLRLDLLVDERVVVEVKSVENLAPVHWKQVLTYLRLLNLPVGLLVNFGELRLKDGLHRIVNPYVMSPSAPFLVPRPPLDAAPADRGAPRVDSPGGVPVL